MSCLGGPRTPPPVVIGASWGAVAPIPPSPASPTPSAAIEAWAARESVRIAAWRTEAIRGGAELDDRPRLLEAMAQVEIHRAA